MHLETSAAYLTCHGPWSWSLKCLQYVAGPNPKLHHWKFVIPFHFYCQLASVVPALQRCVNRSYPQTSRRSPHHPDKPSSLFEDIHLPCFFCPCYCFPL